MKHKRVIRDLKVYKAEDSCKYVLHEKGWDYRYPCLIRGLMAHIGRIAYADICTPQGDSRDCKSESLCDVHNKIEYAIESLKKHNDGEYEAIKFINSLSYKIKTKTAKDIFISAIAQLSKKSKRTLEDDIMAYLAVECEARKKCPYRILLPKP